MSQRRPDIDQIEMRLFDRRGKEIFKWKKAPANVRKCFDTLRRKGIRI